MYIYYPNLPPQSSLRKAMRVLLLEEIGLTSDYKKDFSDYTPRKVHGDIIEKIFLIALRMQLIVNHKFGPAEILPLPDRHPIQAEYNAINGDSWFSNAHKNYAAVEERVDVKTSNTIAKNSLNRFRRDGWYMLNAGIQSGAQFYFMIRNNEAFSLFVETFCEYNSKKGLYKVNHWELPPQPRKFGLELFPGIDPHGYLILIKEVVVALEESGRTPEEVERLFPTEEYGEPERQYKSERKKFFEEFVNTPEMQVYKDKIIERTTAGLFT